MKIVAGIVLLLSIQSVSAGFFSDLQKSFIELKENFGKILTEVITDVKTTIDCTVLSVEHALAIKDIQEAEYQRRCKGEATPQPPVTKIPNTISSTTTPHVKPLVITTEKLNRIDDVNVTDNPDVGETLCDDLEHKVDDHPDLLKFKEALKNKKNRLNEVSAILEGELEKISEEMKSRYARELSNDDSDSSVDTVFNEIVKLRELEKNDKNLDEVKEIDSVFDEILKILDVKNDTFVKRHNEHTMEKNFTTDVNLTEEGSLSATVNSETYNKTEIFQESTTSSDRSTVPKFIIESNHITIKEPEYNGTSFTFNEIVQNSQATVLHPPPDSEIVIEIIPLNLQSKNTCLVAKESLSKMQVNQQISTALDTSKQMTTKNTEELNILPTPITTSSPQLPDTIDKPSVTESKIKEKMTTLIESPTTTINEVPVLPKNVELTTTIAGEHKTITKDSKTITNEDHTTITAITQTAEPITTTTTEITQTEGPTTTTKEAIQSEEPTTTEITQTEEPTTTTTEEMTLTAEPTTTTTTDTTQTEERTTTEITQTVEPTTTTTKMTQTEEPTTTTTEMTQTEEPTTRTTKMTQPEDQTTTTTTEITRVAEPTTTTTEITQTEEPTTTITTEMTQLEEPTTTTTEMTPTVEPTTTIITEMTHNEEPTTTTTTEITRAAEPTTTTTEITQTEEPTTTITTGMTQLEEPTTTTTTEITRAAEPTTTTTEITQTEEPTTTITTGMTQLEEPTTTTTEMTPTVEPTTTITTEMTHNEEPTTTTTTETTQPENPITTTTEITQIAEPTTTTITEITQTEETTTGIIQTEGTTIITTNITLTEKPTTKTAEMTLTEEPTHITTTEMTQTKEPTETTTKGPNQTKESTIKITDPTKITTTISEGLITKREGLTIPEHIAITTITEKPEKKATKHRKIIKTKHRTSFTTKGHTTTETSLPDVQKGFFKIVDKNSKAHEELIKETRNMLKKHKYAKTVLNEIQHNPHVKTTSLLDYF